MVLKCSLAVFGSFSSLAVQGKSGIFSHGSMTIDRLKRNLNETTSSTLGVYGSHPIWQDMCGKLLENLSFSCCFEPWCTHVQLSPFYHLSTIDNTHVRKDTRPSAFFLQPKTAWAWDWGSYIESYLGCDQRDICSIVGGISDTQVLVWPRSNGSVQLLSLAVHMGDPGNEASPIEVSCSNCIIGLVLTFSPTLF